MKKFVAVSIAIFIIVEFIVVTIFLKKYDQIGTEKFVEVLRIIFQSILSGTITFLGLYFTLYSQDVQKEKIEKVKIRPCYIMKSHEKASAEKQFSEVSDSIIVTNKENKILRTTKCSIINTTNNFGINVFVIDTNNNKHYFDIDYSDSCLKFAFPSKGTGQLFIFFEDVYGNNYKQRIDYFLNERNNYYSFISKMPEEVK